MAFWQNVKNWFQDLTNSASKASVGNSHTSYWNEVALQDAERNRAFQTQSAERAMQFSAQEAEKNRQWQEQMSNTAYTRAMADMKNAGLNPILAANLGGSSTPAGSVASAFSASGAQANVSTSNPSNDLMQSLIGALSSALTISLLKK